MNILEHPVSARMRVLLLVLSPSSWSTEGAAKNAQPVELIIDQQKRQIPAGCKFCLSIL